MKIILDISEPAEEEKQEEFPCLLKHIVSKTIIWALNSNNAIVLTRGEKEKLIADAGKLVQGAFDADFWIPLAAEEKIILSN